jgi:hypothetical protein
MQVRSRRHLLPQQMVVPNSGFWLNHDKIIAKDPGLHNPQQRIWGNETAAALSAASTPQGNTPPGKTRDSEPATRPNEPPRTVRTLRWSHSNEEFHLVDGAVMDPRALVPVLEGAQ